MSLFFGNCQQTTVSFPDTTGLISYWKLENNGNDSFGTNHFTTSSNVTYSTAFGKNNMGANFSGATAYSYLQIASNSTLNLGTSDLTMCAWYYPLATNINGGLLCKRKVASNDTMSMNVISSGAIEFSLGAGSTTHTSTYANAITGNTWNFVVCKRTSNTNVQIWINNVKIKEATIPSYNLGGSVPLGIGRYYQLTANEQTLKGNVDEVSLWNRALSDAEIGQLWNNGNGLFY